MTQPLQNCNNHQIWAVKWFSRRAPTPCHVTTALPVMPFKPKALPPVADLWERYSYNPLTGELFSLRRPSLPAVGRPDKSGYLVINMRGVPGKTSLHRLIYKWVHGTEPGETIDHINRVRDDNRFWNLREADWATQLENRPYWVPWNKGLSKSEQADYVPLRLRTS